MRISRQSKFMNLENQPPRDALKNHWVARMPPDLQPYLRLMRFDRPIGIWLLAIPCYWGTALASLADQRALPNLWHLFMFTLGAVAMRGAGCIWNDFLDREIDAQVTRTAMRPIAAGLVSLREALLLMVALMLAGLLILLQFNGFTMFMGFVSIGLVGVYPLMKRFSDFPQVVLGLAFSWGVLLGWTAHYGILSLAPIMLYAAAICWTIGYDTIYAMQDVDDDVMIGIGSTAHRFGEKSKIFVALCYGLSVAIAGSALQMANAGMTAFAGLVVFALLLGKQMYDLHPEDASSALNVFRSNKWAGLIFFFALVLDGFVRFGPFTPKL